MVGSTSLAGLQDAVGRVVAVDVTAMSGCDASLVVSSLTPLMHQLQAFLSSVGAHAVATNQHNAEGAKSGAAWLASQVGVSESQARAQLARERRLSDCPDVAAAVRSGALSPEKGDVIARTFATLLDLDVVETLLAEAPSLTLEALRRRADEFTCSDLSDKGKNWEERQSQYVSIRQSGRFVTGSFRLLNENATWLAEWEHTKRIAAKQDISSEFGELCVAAKEAEAFSAMVAESGGSSRTVVNFHVDVDADDLAKSKCELAGVGVVPFTSVAEHFEKASLALVGTVKNKLEFFSESDRRSNTKELPEYVKRAVAARDRHRCRCCGECFSDIDHQVARCNGGDNRFENLQGLCPACHDAKTKKDAPWTAGGIYAKWKDKR